VLATSLLTLLLGNGVFNIKIYFESIRLSIFLFLLFTFYFVSL